MGVGTLAGASLTETKHSPINDFKLFFENLQKVLQLLNNKLDLKLLFLLSRIMSHDGFNRNLGSFRVFTVNAIFSYQLILVVIVTLGGKEIDAGATWASGTGNLNWN